MVTIPNNQVRVQPLEKVREVYKERSFLFGLIKTEQIKRVNSIGTILKIDTQKEPEKVFLNGVEYVKSNPSNL